MRVQDRAPLHDGAVIFIGNHVGVFRLASTIEVDAIKNELTNPLGPVATVSPPLALACDRLRRLAPRARALILGETGAGKEVYARAVHLTSGRKGRFVAINCGAIPRELVESELFGYRQGAHSTAHQAKPGLIEEAEGGTLFLDEIGEMTGEAQIKLLRFLQDRELTPLGSTRPRRIDVRVIAATNRTVPGSDGKAAGGLRDDIVARLGAAPIHLPPLRSRIEDVGALLAHFLRANPEPKQEQPAFRALCLHGWPLNVRELEKIVTTAAILTTAGHAIALRDLPEPVARAAAAGAPAPATAPRRVGGPSPTPEQLEELLKRYDGNVADAGRARAGQAPRCRLALAEEVRHRPTEVPQGRGHLTRNPRRRVQNVGKRSAPQGFGVDVPEMLLVTVTPAPVGVKLTLPGPSVRLALLALIRAAVKPSITTLSRVTPVMCVLSNPSSVTVGFTVLATDRKLRMVMPL